MARSVTEIYDEIIAYKDSQSALAGLAPQQDNEQQLLAAITSNSKVALWRLWAYTIAVCLHLHEVIWDIYVAKIESLVAATFIGTVAWYRTMVLEFQYTDTVEYNETTKQYGYPVLDTAKRIVKRCAIQERPSGVLTFKVAKEDGSSLIGLTNDEQLALVAYIRKIRFAGTRFTVVTGAGDFIYITGNVHFDAQTPQQTVMVQVEAAINNYIANLDFDSDLFLSKVVDAIQSVDAVVDAHDIQVYTRVLSSDPWSQIDRIHTPVYGYYVVDPSESVSQNVNFIAA
jgi:hypothetical protein